MSTDPLDLLTVLDVAALLKVDRRTVLGWIADGTLEAKDMSRAGGGPRAGHKPRWRVTRAAVEVLAAARGIGQARRADARRKKVAVPVRHFR